MSEALILASILIVHWITKNICTSLAHVVHNNSFFLFWHLTIEMILWINNWNGNTYRNRSLSITSNKKLESQEKRVIPWLLLLLGSLLALQFVNKDAPENGQLKKRRVLGSQLRNPSIYNMICWVAWKWDKRILDQASDVPSIIFFFMIYWKILCK